MEGIHKQPYITNSKWQSFICELQFNLAYQELLSSDQIVSTLHEKDCLRKLAIVLSCHVLQVPDYIKKKASAYSKCQPGLFLYCGSPSFFEVQIVSPHWALQFSYPHEQSEQDVVTWNPQQHLEVHIGHLIDPPFVKQVRQLQTQQLFPPMSCQMKMSFEVQASVKMQFLLMTGYWDCQSLQQKCFSFVLFLLQWRP